MLFPLENISGGEHRVPCGNGCETIESCSQPPHLPHPRWDHLKTSNIVWRDYWSVRTQIWAGGIPDQGPDPVSDTANENGSLPISGLQGHDVSPSERAIIKITLWPRKWWWNILRFCLDCGVCISRKSRQGSSLSLHVPCAFCALALISLTLALTNGLTAASSWELYGADGDKYDSRDIL